MTKKPSEPNPKVETPKQTKKIVPTQKTFSFPFFTPTFIIDWRINKWLKSLVVNQGVVPMKGDSSAGMLMFYQSYIYTKTIIENDKADV